MRSLPNSADRAALAARTRRAHDVCVERFGVDDPNTRRIAAALDRHDRPFTLRISGGLGSGRRAVAAALKERRDWAPLIDDVDELAATRSTPPDAEILCLCTAPCRHEEAWTTRPRHHRILVLATSAGRWGADRPEWARGLVAIDADRPDPATIDAIVADLDGIVRDLPRRRARRLADTLSELAARPTLTDVLEPALSEVGTVGRV